MSSEIQESLENFKVIVAFNRLDYFRKRFAEINETNYRASIGAGIANYIFVPTYSFAANLGQLIVLGYGIYLITAGQFTVGLLIGFLLYLNNFYGPLRQLASVWASFQQSVAALERIYEVLKLETDLRVLGHGKTKHSQALLIFENVYFHYDPEKEVLRATNFELERGKTYALVGPTGGGKTTTASLMARLYDPTKGTIYLEGKDIRTFQNEEKSAKIGFILQDPFLFSGTVRDNIIYGNSEYFDYTNEQLVGVLEQANLTKLLDRFPDGLETSVSGNSLSLGQKQLIAFMRAVLKKPALLILDEATANIDTVTELILEEILQKLPAATTRVIIAHRLNTIKNADQIFFINEGGIIPAGSMEHALDLLLKRKNIS